MRPFTLGGDFFVTLTTNGTPIMLELLEGESIPKSSFKEEARQIDSVIGSLHDLPRPLSTARAPYLRIARLSQSVAFLIASTTDIAAVLPAKPIFIPSTYGQIEYRTAAGQLLIDGVLHD